MTRAVQQPDDGSPRGTTVLPPDLTLAQLDAVPVLEDPADLLIDALTDEEYDAFIAALER